MGLQTIHLAVGTIIKFGPVSGPEVADIRLLIQVSNVIEYTGRFIDTPDIKQSDMTSLLQTAYGFAPDSRLLITAPNSGSRLDKDT